MLGKSTRQLPQPGNICFSLTLTCLLFGGLSWKLQRSLGVETSTVTLPSLLPLLKLSSETAEAEVALNSLASDLRRFESLLDSFLVNLSTVKHWIVFVQSPLMINRFRLLTNEGEWDQEIISASTRRNIGNNKQSAGLRSTTFNKYLTFEVRAWDGLEGEGRREGA